MHNIAPTYLSNISQPSKDVQLRDASSNLRLPRVKTNVGLRSFSYQGAAVLNELEAKEKMDTSLQSFKCVLTKPETKLAAIFNLTFYPFFLSSIFITLYQGLHSGMKNGT